MPASRSAFLSVRAINGDLSLCCNSPVVEPGTTSPIKLHLDIFRYLLCVLVILSIPVSSSCADELVVGKNQVWTRNIKDRIPGTVHKGLRPYAPLYFWMVYQGNKSAIDYMKQNGALPIHHRWSVVVGEGIDLEVPDEEYVEKFSRPLTVGSDSKKVISALARQTTIQETFSWRTWSKKESVSKGIWRVEVVYDDGTPVQCEINQQMKPCVFKLRVQ